MSQDIPYDERMFHMITRHPRELFKSEVTDKIYTAASENFSAITMFEPKGNLSAIENSFFMLCILLVHEGGRLEREKQRDRGTDSDIRNINKQDEKSPGGGKTPR